MTLHSNCMVLKWTFSSGFVVNSFLQETAGKSVLYRSVQRAAYTGSEQQQVMEQDLEIPCHGTPEVLSHGVQSQMGSLGVTGDNSSMWRLIRKGWLWPELAQIHLPPVTTCQMLPPYPIIASPTLQCCHSALPTFLSVVLLLFWSRMWKKEQWRQACRSRASVGHLSLMDGPGLTVSPVLFCCLFCVSLCFLTWIKKFLSRCVFLLAYFHSHQRMLFLDRQHARWHQQTILCLKVIVAFNFYKCSALFRIQKHG